MAWMTLTHACGHTEEKQLYGPWRDRQRKVAAAAQYDCDECKAKAAEAEALEQGLPVLKGSNPQIAWAAEIRRQAIALGKAGDFIKTSDARAWINWRGEFGS